MNLLEARVVLRPRTAADVLDLALPFVLANGRFFARLLAPVAAAGGGLVAALRFGAGWSWPWLWVVVAAYVALAGGAFSVAAGALMFAPPDEVRVRTVLARFARRAPVDFAVTVVRTALIAGGACVIVGWPFLLGPSLFVHEVALLEGAPVFAAFSRSTKLAAGRGGACFLLGAAVPCLPVVCALGFELILGTLVQHVLQLGQPLGSLFGGGGSAFAVAGAFAALPVMAAARFLGYVDMRTRKEGWDLQLRFVAIAEGEAARAGTGAA